MLLEDKVEVCYIDEKSEVITQNNYRRVPFLK